MPLIIADTFSSSLGKLTGQEQSAAKQTAFDLQVNPGNPGLSFHRIDKSKDKYFWSVRVNRDLRIIVHKRGDSVLLAYVDHHDDAYKWAEKRRLEVHPRTGAAQIVVLHERVEDIVVRRVVEETVPKPPVLADESDDTLLDCGVPEDWLDEVRKATEDTLLDVCHYLPAEASEAVLNLAVGIRPEPVSNKPEADPFKHPDAKRRFWTLKDRKELQIAIEVPGEKFSVTLKQAQKDFFTRFFGQPLDGDPAGRGPDDREFSAETGLSFRRRRRKPTDGT